MDLKGEMVRKWAWRMQFPRCSSIDGETGELVEEPELTGRVCGRNPQLLVIRNF